MEELCTLINVLNENEEEVSLLWTALHSLLTEDKEEKEEMLAWLQASPRFETIVFCSSLTNIFLQERRQRYRGENPASAQGCIGWLVRL